VARVSLNFSITLITGFAQAYWQYTHLTFRLAGGRTPADRAAATPLYFLGLVP
jgi:hypothetical protein